MNSAQFNPVNRNVMRMTLYKVLFKHSCDSDKDDDCKRTGNGNEKEYDEG